MKFELREGRWGLMFHYLDKPASSNVSSPTSAEDWNRRLDGFDVGRFAAQVRETGARYVIFTLGQNTGHYCAPNAVYDDIVGVSESRLARRDLISETAAALGPDVKMIAYLPSHPPANHPEAVRALGLTPPWDGGAWGLKKFWSDEENADDKLSRMQWNWEAVVRCWGETWGEAVVGWWIDGCYFADRMYRDAEEPNFHSFARALRAGNADRILAFNSGTSSPLERLTPEQDYTAGEVSTRFLTHDAWTQLEAETDGMQTQILSFAGEYWGRGEPRFPAEFVRGYTRYLESRGVAMTWDVPITEDGEIVEGFRRMFDGGVKLK